MIVGENNDPLRRVSLGDMSRLKLDAPVKRLCGPNVTKLVDRRYQSKLGETSVKHAAIERTIIQYTFQSFNASKTTVELNSPSPAKPCVRSQSMKHKLPLERRQELGLVRPVVHHPERRDGNEKCEKAFPDEDPGPAFLAANTLHAGKGVSQDSAKRPGEHGSGKED